MQDLPGKLSLCPAWATDVQQMGKEERKAVLEKITAIENEVKRAADDAQRYNRYDKRSKLPAWVNQFLVDHHINLSTDMAVDASKLFLRQLAQPVNKTEYAKALLDASAVAQLARSTAAVATGGGGAGAADREGAQAPAKKQRSS